MKAIILSAALAIAAAAPAEAKLTCYHLNQIEQTLDSEYGEKPQFTGREAKAAGPAIEYRLYVNTETGSWSWVGIPAGTELGCLIFAGSAPGKHGKPDAAPDVAAPSAAPSLRPQAQF